MHWHKYLCRKGSGTKYMQLARGVSHSGDGYAYALIALGCWVFWPERGQQFCLAALLAFVIEMPIYLALKKIFRRDRPYTKDNIRRPEPVHEPSDRFSFPSGHASGGFVMAYILSNFYPPITILVYAWASAIGFSRLWLRVHFVSDIVGGVFFGTVVAAVSLYYFGL